MWRQCFVESGSVCSARWPEVTIPLPQPPSARVISPLYLAHNLEGVVSKVITIVRMGVWCTHYDMYASQRTTFVHWFPAFNLHWFQEFCKAFACYSSYQLPPTSSSLPPSLPNSLSFNSCYHDPGWHTFKKRLCASLQVSVNLPLSYNHNDLKRS